MLNKKSNEVRKAILLKAFGICWSIKTWKGFDFEVNMKHSRLLPGAVPVMVLTAFMPLYWNNAANGFHRCWILKAQNTLDARIKLFRRKYTYVCVYRGKAFFPTAVLLITFVYTSCLSGSIWTHSTISLEIYLLVKFSDS